MAHLLAKSSVNAICLIDLGVEEALVVGLHRDAMLGANRCTSTATTAVMFISNLNHIPKYLLYFVGSNFRNIKMKTTVKNKAKDHCSSQLSIGNRFTKKLMK